MRDSADTPGMSDGRSRRTFFRLEIVCQDQPLEMKLKSTPNVPHVEMRAVRGPFLSMRFGRMFSVAFLSSSSVAAFQGLICPAAVDPKALVFATREGLPLDRWNLLGKHLKPAAKKLRLPGVTWHLLRHSHATMLDSVGTPIGTMQSLLGHSTPDITREIYLHAIPEEQRRAVDSVEKLVLGPKWTQVRASAQTTSGRVN